MGVFSVPGIIATAAVGIAVHACYSFALCMWALPALAARVPLY